MDLFVSTNFVFHTNNSDKSYQSFSIDSTIDRSPQKIARLLLHIFSSI